MDNERSDELDDAKRHFQKLAEKSILLEELMAESGLGNSVDITNQESRENRVRKHIALAQARYDSGNLSEHELLFHKCFAIETQVHESRWSNGLYNDLLEPISEKMRDVERKHGLSENEYWPISEAPDEYQELSREYDAVMEQKLLDTFEEFGATDLRELFVSDPIKFHELHNIGYTSAFVKNERTRLKFLANVYEKEAKVSSNAGAYFSAAVMLGAAIEARLIITCLDNEEKVRETLVNIGLTNKTLKSKNPLTWKLETLIDVCFSAGWISKFDVGEYSFDGHAMLNFLRSMRNNVHPGVKVRKSNGLVLGEEQYKTIMYAHKLLASSLNWDANYQVESNG